MASANLGKIRVLEVHAEGYEAGFLLLDAHEVERLIVEDNVQHLRLALDLRQQIAEIQHGESAVAAQGDRLLARISQLCPERVGRGIRHRRP